MNNNIPHRIWVPLYILHLSSPLYTKIKLQKLTFLTQYSAKIDDYDFVTYHYGPYSQMLNRDTMGYPSLITHKVGMSSRTNQQYYTFSITDEGEQLLKELLESVDGRALKSIQYNLKHYSEMSSCKLLEEVYSTFAIIKGDSHSKWQEVRSELVEVRPPLLSCFEKHGNRQSVFALSVLEIVEMTLNAVKNISDTTQRGVVMNLSREIIHKCKEITKQIIPPSDSETLRRHFVEIGEIEGYLREYCDTRKILVDPLKQPLEETMTEDEAERVAEALKHIKLHA